jgi:hypothetical protein
VTATANNDNSHSSNGQRLAFAVLPFEHFIGVVVVGKGCGCIGVQLFATKFTLRNG